MNKVKNRAYWLGKESFENKDYKTAETYFKELIDEGLEFADVFKMMGIINHEAGRFEVAIQYLKKALNMNANYTEASMNLAVIYNDMGELDKAQEIYADAKGRSSQKSSISYLDSFSLGKISNLHADLGDIYHGAGMHVEAIDEYQKALKLNSDFYDIRIKLGVVLKDAGRIGEAIVELRKVIKNNPDYNPAYLNLGLCYFKRGNNKEARETWEKSKEIDPENKTADLYLKMLESSK